MSLSFKDIVRWILKALRWPAIYIMPPAIILFIIIPLFTSSDEFRSVSIVATTVLFFTILTLAFVGGIITSTFFTERFLVSTGIAAGMFALIGLFMPTPSGLVESAEWAALPEHRAMIMIVCFVLVFMVFLGDLIVLLARKIFGNKV